MLSQFSKFQQNLEFLNFVQNEDIGEHSICNFSTNIVLGQGNSSGRRQNIVQIFAQILATILGVENYTKTATLTIILFLRHNVTYKLIIDEELFSQVLTNN